MPEQPTSRLKRFQDFLDERGLEAREHEKMPRLERFAHFWLVVTKWFVGNRCPVRASALAYTTLLALVPLLAVAIGVSSSFLKKGGEEPIERLIDGFVANVAPQLNLEMKGEGAQAEAKRAEVVAKIKDFVDNIQSGKLNTTGMIGLVFVAIMLLSNIEVAFNDIWGVSTGRNWVGRVVNYWAALTLGPILIALVVGLTSGPHIESTKDFFAGMPVLGNLLFRFVPFVIPSLGFALFYKLMPNTRVDLSAALVGGVTGGVLWQLNNLLNVAYLSNVVTYSKIYGSLMALPLFLAGLYMSWLILLFGAQVGYAFQNRSLYLDALKAGSVNQRGREFIALRMMTLIAARFDVGQSAAQTELSRELGVPGRLVSEILSVLLKSDLVQEVSDEGGAFVPARPPSQITVHEILMAIRAGQGQELATREDTAREKIRAEHERVQQAEADAAKSVTLEALVDRCGTEDQDPRPPASGA
ncbi:MAG: YihY family inner membrane protein [Verrucomicrobia bacterium]|nr:YihY family inner membrane protein [Verrucomicrobiota bacterium]